MFLVLIGSCKNDNKIVDPTAGNHAPVILSTTVFPDTLIASDSAIVVVNAMDPDADTLVYEWITDGRLDLKGAIWSNRSELYNLHENFCVVYPKAVNDVPLDTAWIRCYVRDRKGQSDNQVLYFVVRQ